MNNLLGKSHSEFEELCRQQGWPRYRARQLYDWIYHRRVESFDQMSDLPAAMRATLTKDFSLKRPAVVEEKKADDGTVKYIFTSAANPEREFEAVWLPFAPAPGSQKGMRISICISSQAGCTLDCLFCATGKLDLLGNLDAADITGQVLEIEKRNGRATNIVFMGMGEPFYNYNNVIAAARLLGDVKGIGFNASKITISTAGVLPRIRQFTDEEQPFGLAISLNHSHEAGRDRVMPVNKKWSMSDLHKAALDYTRRSKKRITFEYVMMAGENMSADDARNLMKYVGGLNCRINLIPLNTSFEGLHRPSEQEVAAFQKMLEPLKKSGVRVFNRRSPARSIDGACGMLALKRQEV